jgi:hypothetical protein
MNDLAPAPVRISAEAAGRVRALRQKVDAEDAQYTAVARILMAPFQQRLARHPYRNFRPQALADLEKAWHHDLPSTYRLSCRSTLTRDSLEIYDTGICASKLEQDDWTDQELSLVIAHGHLEVRRGTVAFTCTIPAIFSLHALARYIMRSVSTTTDDDLLDDVALLAGHDADEVSTDEGFAIHTRAGTWRGRCVRLDSGQRVLSIRTWIDR